VGAATDFKSNIIISEELPEQLELEDWVTNGIFRTAIVIKSPVFINYFDNYCFADFYIDFLLFHHLNYLCLLFLLYYFLCCFVVIYSLSSNPLFKIVVVILDIINLEYFGMIMNASFVLVSLFCFKIYNKF
jgi:hypothetical protein